MVVGLAPDLNFGSSRMNVSKNTHKFTARYSKDERFLGTFGNSVSVS
jgi:hypothetical protein